MVGRPLIYLTHFHNRRTINWNFFCLYDQVLFVILLFRCGGKADGQGLALQTLSRMCPHVHVHVSACVCACVRMCMCMCMCPHVHVHVSACVCACVRMCMCMCMCPHVHVHVSACVDSDNNDDDNDDDDQNNRDFKIQRRGQ